MFDAVSSVGGTVLMAVALFGLQAGSASTALERLAESAPLVFVLLVGLYLLFRAYQSVTERLIDVVRQHAEATTKMTGAVERLDDNLTENIRTLTSRVTDLERERNGVHHER